MAKAIDYDKHEVEVDHSKCKYFYIGKLKKQKKSWDSLRNKGLFIEYEVPVFKCGLNASSVILDDNQPICKDFEGVK